MKKEIQEYLTYLSPEFIYIPFDKVETLHIKRNKKVYNNMFLGCREDGSKIYSPVSGNIVGIKEMKYIKGTSNSLVVENNFIDQKEKLNPYMDDIFKMKKTEINEKLNNYSLLRKFSSKTTLIVNSTYNKKNDLSDMVINYEYYEEILETLDELLSLYNMKTCYICIDRNDLYSEAAYNKYINAFPNICLVKNNKRFRSDICVFYNIEDILAIHKCLYQDYFQDFTFLTIYTGETTIVKVKLYTSFYELLKALKIPYKNKKILVNNVKIDSINDLVISSDVKSIELI